MRMTISVLSLMCSVGMSMAQISEVQPRILTKSKMEGAVTEVEVAPRFVTAIRMPEAVNSVVVGDPALFQVEHSEKEPELVFIKALTASPAQTNLLVSTIRGRQASLLVVSRGDPEALANVDFLLRYKPTEGFLIGPSVYPSVMVGETLALSQTVPTATIEGSTSTSPSGPILALDPAAREPGRGSLDELLSRQEVAALPELYGERISIEDSPGDRVRAGVSEVIDAGQRVLVLFSVVNPTDQSILLMPPQVQLAGKTKSGFLIKRSQWSAAEQLPVLEYRLSKRRLGPRERADGVAAFERPPYKQSNETLLLQLAEAGAVDRPALAPIGFGISTFVEDGNGTSR
jgi:hypothetical protein